MNSQRNISVEKASSIPIEEQHVELVERKGIGHPDSICDSIMEATCLSLCREYQDRFGRILHHNIDKGLLVAGRTSPQLGGGKVLEPMRLIFGDRATYKFDGISIPIGEIAETTARRWLREHLRFVDPEKHIVFQNEIKPGSPELIDIFSRQVIGANDTSVGVGYAPLSETERLVLAAEKFLNAPSFKDSFPEAGEDIKIMGYRFGKSLTLTVAIAFVDRYVRGAKMYFDRKYCIQQELQRFITEENRSLDSLTVTINTLDDPGRGETGMYLTVLGTSAEAGDGGQVGRGNRVNGVIAFNRPSTTEAAAGKNPVSHVGKIYNLLSHEIAFRIYREVGGIREAIVFLCSQIGKPIDQPLIAAAQLIMEPEILLEDVRDSVAAVIDSELGVIQSFTSRLARGEFAVC
ncbi:MAG: methionine adenosyltransferase [Pseudomonadota bacterium]